MNAISRPKIEIIAELAQGFEGKPEQAELLLRAAAAAGADAAKFQMVYADELATPGYEYYELFKTLEMSDDVWSTLYTTAQNCGIALHLDIFGPRSLALAASLGASTVKLHGTDIANLGFLNQVAESSIERVMLGAGGALWQEIENALKVLSEKEVVVLLGFQAYPTPNDTNQIARVSVLNERLPSSECGVSIGFADHAPPDDPTRFSLAACALGAGARVFEKHLTLSQNLKLEDHESALNPDEFGEFCDVIRKTAEAFGKSAPQDDFGMSEAEKGYRAMIRRHVVSARELPAGANLEPGDVVLKRSAAEQPITDLDRIYGRTLARALPANSAIQTSDLQDGTSE